MTTRGKHKRRLAISSHAIERFRERVDEEFRHRNDEDLGNLLDTRIHHSEFSWEVSDPRAPAARTTLKSVTCRNATYYAVVRDATVITLLDEEMARNNFEGQWPPVNTPFSSLKDLKIPVAPPSPSPKTAVPHEEDPIALAGITYARARQQLRVREAEVAALKARLEQATEEMLEAKRSLDEAHDHLVQLTDAPTRSEAST